MSSIFGAPKPNNLFGSSQPNNQGGTGLFGGFGSSNQQTGSTLFGGSTATNNQQGQQQQTGGLGIFGQSQNQQQNQPQQQQASNTFGSGLPQPQGPLLGAINNYQQQQPQQPQQQQQNTGLFGQSQGLQQQPSGLFNSTNSQNPQSQLAQSSWQINSAINPREKSVGEQMQAIMEKWDTGNPNCTFRHYFYNKVSDEVAPYYGPTANEDPKKWEEALAKRPGPGFIPVLCSGFQQMGERIKTQQQNLGAFNERLHQINSSLSCMLQTHDTNTSIRAMDAKRKHIVLKQRCLALATKVQVLRNRGYAMLGDEEDLRAKLLALEKNASDPGMNARSEEIWARMITVQERAKLLKAEIERSGTQDLAALDEDTEKQAKKILEDYQTQLVHLKKELDKIQEDYVKWEKDQNEQPTPPVTNLKASGR